jgi:hypothetical protein
METVTVTACRNYVCPANISAYGLTIREDGAYHIPLVANKKEIGYIIGDPVGNNSNMYFPSASKMIRQDYKPVKNSEDMGYVLYYACKCYNQAILKSTHR